MYPETIELAERNCGFCTSSLDFAVWTNSGRRSTSHNVDELVGCEGETSRALGIPIEMVPLLPGDSELLSQLGFCDPPQNALALTEASDRAL